jgi:CubicO group peptidase (beta-lactamase class C family)
MKAVLTLKCKKSTLSTDRPSPSSAVSLKLAIAFLAMLSFMACKSGFAQAPPRSLPHDSVGQRLAADLTWTQPERDVRFARMDTLFPTHRVRRRGVATPLSVGPRLELPQTMVRYMTDEHLAGVLVLQQGHVRLERYALGLTPSSRWTGFSMTKAVTDTLVGVALRHGSIRSLDDDVVRYLPEMRGSAYDGVTVRQLMTMTSGARWNENYTTADADNVLLYSTPVAPGLDPTVEYMRKLPRAAAPGSRWAYNTGETDLLGVLLRRATGQTLAHQLQTAVWSHAGMEEDATWITNAPGAAAEEFGGSGLSATLRDFGRLGLWVLERGHSAVPDGWFQEATRAQVQAGTAGYGYGWWPQPDGSFAALGIFGQSILIDPQRQLVIVTLGDWSEATGAAHSKARAQFWNEVKAAVDGEHR